jgi:F0F1-type ATP synthase assembly protein I
MAQYIVKLLISASVIVAVSEIAKRSSVLGALIASLPLTSLIAIVWLYAETHDAQKIIDLSRGIFWLVLPSLALFIILPALMRAGVGFALSLALSCIATALCYKGMLVILPRFGVQL